MRAVSHERVQQRAAEQIEDAPQFPAEVVEAVEVTGVTETSSQDLWLRTLKQFLVLSAASTDFFKPQTV